MDEKKMRSIDEIKPLDETEASSKVAKHTEHEGKREEESDDPSARAPSNAVDDASSLNLVTVKGDNSSSAASASSSPPTAEDIAAVLQNSPEAFFHRLAATFLETVDGEELMQLQSKSKWLASSECSCR